MEDPRDALRRYLEQRRELGESELVLDRLQVDEALKLLGAAPPVGPQRLKATPVTPEQRPMASRSVDVPPARAAAADVPSHGADWRTALKEAGMGAKQSRDADPAAPAAPVAPKAPSATAPATPPAPTAEPAPKTGRYSLLPTPPAAAPDDTTVRPATPRAKGSAPWSTIDLSTYPDGLVAGRSGDEGAGPLAAVTELADIAARIAACTACGLHATARNPVPGAGNPQADFVVVGEAPGETEDETGLPFVGASGKLLTDILGAIELTRDNVFICNVIKHRPPGNRNPAPDEIAACSHYLVRQIELIQPKVIMAFGTFAAQTLLRTSTPIGKLRGQVHRYHGVPLIVTYHPAALLRNPAWKRPTWEDVQLARRILDRATTGA